MTPATGGFQDKPIWPFGRRIVFHISLKDKSTSHPCNRLVAQESPPAAICRRIAHLSQMKRHTCHGWVAPALASSCPQNPPPLPQGTAARQLPQPLHEFPSAARTASPGSWDLNRLYRHHFQRLPPDIVPRYLLRRPPPLHSRRAHTQLPLPPPHSLQRKQEEESAERNSMHPVHGNIHMTISP